jgi:hypothetical protein
MRSPEEQAKARELLLLDNEGRPPSDEGYQGSLFGAGRGGGGGPNFWFTGEDVTYLTDSDLRLPRFSGGKPKRQVD